MKLVLAIINSVGLIYRDLVTNKKTDFVSYATKRESSAVKKLEKLMELRRKMQIPGRHPGCKTCKNLGTENCRCKDNLHKSEGHTCNCHSNGGSEDLVAEITRRVLAALR